MHARNEERAARERLRLAQADPTLAQRLRLALDAPPPADLSAASPEGTRRRLHEATRERREGPPPSEHTAAAAGPCACMDARMGDGTSESSASELSESLTTIFE